MDSRINTVEEYPEELSPARKVLGNVIAGSFIFAAGLFLLLCGTGIIGLAIEKVALPACFMSVGLTLLVTSLINKNPVSLWLSWVFDVPAVVSIVAAYTFLGYGDLYPFYIAIPAIASLFTLPMTPKSASSHLKAILFFGVLAFLFMLNSLMGIGWNIVLPVLLSLAGLCIIGIAVAVSAPVNTK